MALARYIAMFALLGLGPAYAQDPSSATTTVANVDDAQDALRQCAREALKDADRSALKKWIFAILSNDPDMRALAKIDAETQERIDREAAEIFESLVVDKCLAQTRALAVHSENADVGGYFSDLVGQLAAEALFDRPDFESAVEGSLKYFDAARVERALNAD